MMEKRALFAMGKNMRCPRTASVFKPRDTRFARTSSTDTMKCYAVDFTIHAHFSTEKNGHLMPKLPFDTVEYIRDPVLLTRLINLFDELTRIWLLGVIRK